MGLFTPLHRLLHADRKEVSRDDLIQHVVDGIVHTRTYGPAGAILLPPGLHITVILPSGHPARQLVDTMLHQPGFDSEVEHCLANQLPDVGRHGFPLRSYAVEEGEDLQVTVTAADSVLPARLTIQGGDLYGKTVELAADQRRFHLGRGPWHGPDHRIPNEVIVTRVSSWVSRRAAILDRCGAIWTVSTRDQRECLTIIHPDGRRVRPWMTPWGQATLLDQDQLAFSDGTGREIQLLFQAPGMGRQK